MSCTHQPMFWFENWKLNLNHSNNTMHTMSPALSIIPYLSSSTSTTSPTHHHFIQIISTNSSFNYFSKPPPASSSAITFSKSSFRVFYRYSSEDDDDAESCSFDEAVALFNKRDYYRCHDCLEYLWNESEEPIRTLIHGILQCAVGFYHLFNQVIRPL